MASKKGKSLDEPDEPLGPVADEPAPEPLGEIQPGCSTPGTVSPSVSGTSQDPTRKDKEKEY